MTSFRERLRVALLALSALGVAVFLGGLLASYLAPLTLEQATREVIRIEVERRVGKKIDALTDGRLAGLARKALERTTADADRLERQLREQLPQRVAAAVAELLKADCACRRRLAERATQAHEDQLGSLRQAQASLSDWIEQAYAQTRNHLLHEFRIFATANAALFALLGLVCAWRRHSTLQLALVALTLVGAGAVVASFYLFKQDWLHTLVFNDYMGWGYASCLAGTCALLADVAFNQAKVTTTMLDAAFHVVGSASPC